MPDNENCFICHACGIMESGMNGIVFQSDITFLNVNNYNELICKLNKVFLWPLISFCRLPTTVLFCDKEEY